VVHRLKHEVLDVRAQIEFPLAQKRAPTVIQILSEVTQILPAGTWLTEFAFNDGKVHVQGFSNAPSDLIGLVRTSPTRRTILRRKPSLRCHSRPSLRPKPTTTTSD
jgi:Fimbrial assembly protein (PilN)